MFWDSSSLLALLLPESRSATLTAALAWCEGQPTGEVLVCTDRRLRDAAAKHEGFDLYPE